MDILKWLKLGMAMFLYFNSPNVQITPNAIIINVEVSTVLTEEMKQLIKHGVSFEYELYTSLLVYNEKNEKELFRKKIYRKIYYNYQTQKFILEKNKSKIMFDTIIDLIDNCRKFENITYQINTTNYKRFSFFAQLSLVKNPLIEEQLHMSTDSLWDHYKPSIKYKFKNIRIKRK